MKKPAEKLGKAWLIRWVHFGEHVIPLVKKYAPNGAVVDVLSSRKSFEYALEYTKSIYRFSVLSLSEKLPFAHYTNGEKYNKDFFSRVPISTHYQSSWFKEIKKIEMENPGSEIVLKKWKESLENNLQYATIGHNPCLELRKVFNLTEKEGDGGEVVVTWEERV